MFITMQFLFSNIKACSSSYFWSRPSTALLLFNAVIFFAAGGEAVVQIPKNVKVPAVFAFGDSIVDQGNNNEIVTVVKCNFLPYGKDFMGGKPTGRYSNAKTPADMIAEQLGIKELVPAYLDPNLQSSDLLTGVSFASGAAGFDPQTSQIASAISMSDQLKLFREYKAKVKALVGEEKTNFILSNSVYFVVAGSDDLANTYFTVGTRRFHYDIPSYANLVVSFASQFVQGLYKEGARRIAVLGVPPVGCLPSQRTLAGGPHRMCPANYNQAAVILNSKLSSGMDSLNASLPQAKIAFIDIYYPFLDIIQNPVKYGFEVVDRGCCGTGEIEVVILCNKLSPTCPDDTKFLFWDSYHPTERGYRILVDRILPKFISKFV